MTKERILSKEEKFVNIWGEVNSFLITDKFQNICDKSFLEMKNFIVTSPSYKILTDVFFQKEDKMKSISLNNEKMYQLCINEGLYLIRFVLTEFIGEPIVTDSLVKYDTVEEYMNKFSSLLLSKEKSIVKSSKKDNSDLGFSDILNILNETIIPSHLEVSFCEMADFIKKEYSKEEHIREKAKMFK